MSTLVTPSAEIGIDYERLEFLGDSFLNYLVTTMLYISETQVKELHQEYVRAIHFVKMQRIGAIQTIKHGDQKIC